MSSAQDQSKSVYSGDLIGLFLSTRGYVGIPPPSEPIPESAEKVTHLRILKNDLFTDVDYSRNMFRIESDVGQKSELVFGSVVKLTHVPTGFVLIASDTVDDDSMRDSSIDTTSSSSNSKAMSSVFLRRTLRGENELAHKWIISPRYKLREEGDPVHVNDFVILRSVLFKNKFLAFPPPPVAKRFTGGTMRADISGPAVDRGRGPSGAVGDDGCGLDTADGAAHDYDPLVALEDAAKAYSVPGFQVVMLMKRHYAESSATFAAPPALIAGGGGGAGGVVAASGGGPRAGGAGATIEGGGVDKFGKLDESQELLAEGRVVVAGDYIRVVHREYAGNLICRIDDEREMQSVVSVLGSLCKKQTQPKDGTHGIFIRSLSSQEPWEQFDFPVMGSSLGIWQIYPVAKSDDDVSLARPILFGTAIRLRHLVTGQYLSIRPMTDADSPTVKEHNLPLDGNLNVVSKDDLLAYEMESVRGWGGGGAGAGEVGEGGKFGSSGDEDAFGAPRRDGLMRSNSTPRGNKQGAGGIRPISLSRGNSKNGKKGKDKRTNSTASALIGKFASASISAGNISLDGERVGGVSGIRDSTPSVVHRWVVATSEQPDENTVFSVYSTDSLSEGPDITGGAAIDAGDYTACVKYSENLHFLHSATKLNLKLCTPAEKLQIYQQKQKMDAAIQSVRFDGVAGGVGEGAEDAALSGFATSPGDTIGFGGLGGRGGGGGGGVGAAVMTMDGGHHHETDDHPWWEYKWDRSVLPVRVDDDTVLDSDVCTFEKVSREEIEDIMFCARFPVLAKGATAMLQLSPHQGILYTPMFRHFFMALQTLVVWLLGRYENSFMLADSASLADFEQDSEMMMDMLDSFSVGSGDEDMDGEEGDGAGAISADENGPSGANDSKNSKIGSGTPTTPGSVARSELSGNATIGDTYRKRRNVSFAPRLRRADEVDEEFATQNVQESSLAPWLGRRVRVANADPFFAAAVVEGRGRSSSARVRGGGPRIHDPFKDSPPSKRGGAAAGSAAGVEHMGGEMSQFVDLNVKKIVDDFVSKASPAKEIILRRQVILADFRLLEILLNFLHIVVILERERSIHDAKGISDGKDAALVPPAVLKCCEQIQHVLHCAVLHNQKSALKVISLHGALFSMMSQKVLGWDPPIETVLRLTCNPNDAPKKDVHSADVGGTGEGVLTGPADASAALEQAEKEEENGVDIERILVRSVTANDVRQIVQQMVALHCENHPRATKVLGLLTLLCSSGNAKIHFQNLLVNSITTLGPTYGEDFSVQAGRHERPSAAQTDCLLFYTSLGMLDEWQVTTDTGAFVVPASETEEDEEFTHSRMREEARNLRRLFDEHQIVGNSRDDALANDNSVLDVDECFHLCEDLGFSGQRLYEGIRALHGKTFWELLHWWCGDCSLYFPSSCAAQNLMNPEQAMLLLHLPVEESTPGVPSTVSSLSAGISLKTAISAVDYRSIISIRMPGLALKLSDSLSHDHRGLGGRGLRAAAEGAFAGLGGGSGAGKAAIASAAGKREGAKTVLDDDEGEEEEEEEDDEDDEFFRINGMTKEQNAALLRTLSTKRRETLNAFSGSGSGRPLHGIEESKASSAAAVTASAAAAASASTAAAAERASKARNRFKGAAHAVIAAGGSGGGASKSTTPDGRSLGSSGGDSRSAMLSTSPRKRATRHRRHHAKSTNDSGTWMSIFEALNPAKNEDFAWMRGSLLLLCELCRGKNARAQRIVSVIIPPELLIDCLMSNEVKPRDKAVFCDLLGSVYLNHDLVFPSRIVPVYDHGPIFCGWNEEITTSTVTMGFAFNSFTRVKYAGCRDGTQLRAHTFQFISSEVVQLELFSPSSTMMTYVRAVLNLLHLLLQCGFFNDPAFDFFGDVNSSSSAGSGDLSVEMLRALMLQKLDYAMSIHESDRFNPREPYPDYLSEDDLDLEISAVGGESPDSPTGLRGLLGRRSPSNNRKGGSGREGVSFSLLSGKDSVGNSGGGNGGAQMGVTGSGSKGFSGGGGSGGWRRNGGAGGGSALTLSISPTGFTRHFRKSLEHISLLKSHFDSIFADSVYSSVIKSVITILCEIHEISQILRIQRLWNQINDAPTRMMRSAYNLDKSGYDSLDTLMESNTNIVATVESAFPQQRNGDNGYIKTILLCMLHDDRHLQSDCVQLINRHISLRRDACRLAGQVQYRSSARDTMLQRYFNVFLHQLVKYSGDIFARPTPVRVDSVQRLIFVIESIKALCFSSIGSKLEESQQQESSSRRAPGGSKRPSRRGSEGSYAASAVAAGSSAFAAGGGRSGSALSSGEHHRKPRKSGWSLIELTERDHLSGEQLRQYLGRVVPNPHGDDDHFDLNLREVRNSKAMQQELIDRYCSSRQQMCDSAMSPRIDPFLVMREFTAHIAPIIRKQVAPTTPTAPATTHHHRRHHHPSLQHGSVSRSGSKDVHDDGHRAAAAAEAGVAVGAGVGDGMAAGKGQVAGGTSIGVENGERKDDEGSASSGYESEDEFLKQDFYNIAGTMRTWISMYEAEQFVLNRVFEFMAQVGIGCKPICDVWFHSLGDVILEMFPSSPGSCELMIALVANCSADILTTLPGPMRKRLIHEESESVGEAVAKHAATSNYSISSNHSNLSGLAAGGGGGGSNFLEIMLKKLDIWLESNPPEIGSRLLSALMIRGDRALSSTVTNFIGNSMDKFIATFNIGMVTMLQSGSYVDREALYHALQPIAVLCGLDTYLPDSIMKALRGKFPLVECSTILQNKDSPLQIKAWFLEITYKLYPDQCFLIEQAMLQELRGIRMYFSIAWPEQVVMMNPIASADEGDGDGDNNDNSSDNNDENNDNEASIAESGGDISASRKKNSFRRGKEKMSGSGVEYCVLYLQTVIKYCIGAVLRPVSLAPAAVSTASRGSGYTYGGAASSGSKGGAAGAAAAAGKPLDESCVPPLVLEDVNNRVLQGVAHVERETMVSTSSPLARIVTAKFHARFPDVILNEGYSIDDITGGGSDSSCFIANPATSSSLVSTASEMRKEAGGGGVGVGVGGAFAAVPHHHVGDELAEGEKDSVASSLPPTAATVSSLVVNCYTLMLNSLQLKSHLLLNALTQQDVDKLIWLGTAILMLIEECHLHEEDDRSRLIDSFDYLPIRKRLSGITQGLLKDEVLKVGDDYVRSRFVDYQLDIAKAALRNPEDRPSIISTIINAFATTESHQLSESYAIAAEYSNDFLRRTNIANLLSSKLAESQLFSHAGGDILFARKKSSLIKSRSFARKFEAYSDFQIWMRGGGRIFSALFAYLGQTQEPDQAEYNFLHILSSLLHNNIEAIRESEILSVRLKMAYVEKETLRIRNVQRALEKSGASQLVLSILGRSYSQADDLSESYTWRYTALALKFGSELLAYRNKDLQDSLVSNIRCGILENKPPEMYCLLGLKRLARKCVATLNAGGSVPLAPQEGGEDRESAHGDSHGTTYKTPQEGVKLATYMLMQLFSFVGAFCKGENRRSKEFLAGDDGGNKLILDIVMELSLLTNTTISFFLDKLRYISHDKFYDKLAPDIWSLKDRTKRRYFAWHDPQNDVLIITRYLEVLSCMFDNLASMCCASSQSALSQAMLKSAGILEFVGLLQLKAVSVIGEDSSAREVTWKGGRPFHFYRVYMKELAAAGLLDTVPDFEDLRNAVNSWHRGRSNAALKTVNYTASRDFQTVFGVSYDLLQYTVRKAEYRILRLLLAILDTSSFDQKYSITSTFSDAILLQNMDSRFHKIHRTFRPIQKEAYASTTVAYISLLETIGITYDEETDELLADWDADMLQQGHRAKSIYGVVELLGENNNLQRLYFSVPAFVQKYWQYPEVQMVKDRIVQEVNRDSPEEKISDFLTQMNSIAVVMRRQERLRLFLTPFVHPLFGGQPIPYLSRVVPRLRVMLLLLTLLFNGYFAYEESIREDVTAILSSPQQDGGAFIMFFTGWQIRLEQFIQALQGVHFVMVAMLGVRYILNSSAADELLTFSLSDEDSLPVRLFLQAITTIVGLVYLILDSFWPFCLVLFSTIAYWFDRKWFYVPCLLDVIFLFKDMYFLYLAITRNLIKIAFTLVLAFLCLYFFSVITYLYFPGQYFLDEHMNCNSLVACFKTHLDYGIMNPPYWENEGYIDPQIAGLSAENSSIAYGPLAARIFGTTYSLTYIILINFVLSAIISGLIIDTFSEMRAENEVIQADIADKCFICSITKDEFEQAGISFKTHIKEEHNMWHYVWFKLYLELADPLGYSAAENAAVIAMQDSQSFVKMMPIKRSLSLEKETGAKAEGSSSSASAGASAGGAGGSTESGSGSSASIDAGSSSAGGVGGPRLGVSSKALVKSIAKVARHTQAPLRETVEELKADQKRITALLEMLTGQLGEVLRAAAAEQEAGEEGED